MLDRSRQLSRRRRRDRRSSRADTDPVAPDDPDGAAIRIRSAPGFARDRRPAGAARRGDDRRHSARSPRADSSCCSWCSSSTASGATAPTSASSAARWRSVPCSGAALIARLADRVDPLALIGVGFTGMGLVSLVFWNAPQVSRRAVGVHRCCSRCRASRAAALGGDRHDRADASPPAVLGRVVGVMRSVESIGNQRWSVDHRRRARRHGLVDRTARCPVARLHRLRRTDVAVVSRRRDRPRRASSTANASSPTTSCSASTSPTIRKRSASTPRGADSR